MIILRNPCLPMAKSSLLLLHIATFFATPSSILTINTVTHSTLTVFTQKKSYKVEPNNVHMDLHKEEQNLPLFDIFTVCTRGPSTGLTMHYPGTAITVHPFTGFTKMNLVFSHTICAKTSCTSRTST